MSVCVFPDKAEEELRLIKINEVIRLTSISRSQIYGLIQRGEFPAAVKVKRSSRWIASEVNDWIKVQIEWRSK